MHGFAFRLHGTRRKSFFDRCGFTFTLNHVLRTELCNLFLSLCRNYAPLIKRDNWQRFRVKGLHRFKIPPLKNCPDILFTLFIEVAEYCIVPVACLKLKDTVKCVYVPLLCCLRLGGTGWGPNVPPSVLCNPGSRPFFFWAFFLSWILDREM